jgi:hypothetical protein
VVLFTLANDGEPIAINPRFITAIMQPQKEDAQNVGARIFLADDDEFAILVEDEFELVVNQVSNALAFSIVSRAKDK